LKSTIVKQENFMKKLELRVFKKKYCTFKMQK
jgi:hypothetical protein